MGKFLSKIAPTVNSGQNIKAANSKVSRKVLYRRLQSSRPHQQREYIPVSDFVTNFWGIALTGGVIYLLHLRGVLEDYLPKLDKENPFKLEQSLYEKIRDEFLNKDKKSETDNEKSTGES